MSREIKFRFRMRDLTKDGYREWFEYYSLDDLIRGGGATTAAILSKDQFTGLHDKNGKEIYEGDLVREPFGAIQTVLWEPGGFILGSNRMSLDLVGQGFKFTIVGNIYENPELLKVKP